MLFKILTVTALTSLSSAQTLLEVLSSQNASLSTLNTLLTTQPALISALGSASNITVLAPNNQAISTFLNSSAGTAAAANPGAVAALLTYHVLNGTYFASDFDDTSDFIPTLLTNTTYENVTGSQVLDLVLSGQNATIYSGLKANSSIVTPNLNFTGGVIHIIDKVLTLPTPPSNTTLDLGLTALVGALTQANLLSTVDSLSDITIFAPSNAAFQAISSATSNLTIEQLTSILTYHVINGTVAYSSDLSDETITTLGGQSLRIEVEDGNVFVNSAKVVIADVLVANGVVHVIDNVLNPANTTASAPTGTATGSGSPAFSGASSASDIPFTSGVTATTTAAISTVTSTASGTGAGTSTSSSSTGGASMPTGAIGAAALFGAAGLFAANV